MEKKQLPLSFRSPSLQQQGHFNAYHLSPNIPVKECYEWKVLVSLSQMRTLGADACAAFQAVSGLIYQPSAPVTRGENSLQVGLEEIPGGNQRGHTGH